MRTYRLSAPARNAANDLIEDLLDADMIYENGSSSRAYPFVVVAKAHQVGQFCITIYRALDKLSTNNDVISELGNVRSSYYASLDLKASFHNLKLRVEDQEMSSFTHGKTVYS
jgi:hypothetical protein